MRKSILGVSIITLTLALSFSLTYADDTPADLTTVGQKVVNLQGNDTGLPSGVSEQKGTIGTILSKMFDTTGKIGNYYIKALDTPNRAVSTGKILKWNGGATGNFVDSLIWDTGNNIGVGALPSPVFATSNLRLDIGGNVGANQYCDENGGNCFTAAEANVTGTIIGGGGTTNYVTKFTGTGTIGNSLIQDNGSVITMNNVLNANAGIQIDGNAFVSGDGTEVRATRSSAAGNYGYYGVYNSTGQRGAYFGWGNGGTTVDLFIDNADTLAISGGNVTMAGTLGVTGTVSGATPTLGTHLTTKSYVDGLVAGGNLWTTNGTNIYNNNTGNVGIGTNTPSNKLHVTGNIGATGWIGAGCETGCETGGGYSLLYANGNAVFRGSPAYGVDAQGATYAVVGRTTSASYGGVLGYSENGSIYGILGHANAYSLYGNGAIYVSGNIQTGGGVKTTCVGNCF